MEVLLASTALVIILGLIASAVVLLHYIPMGLWISAVTAGVPITIPEMIGMRRRKVPQARIVPRLIATQKAGFEVSIPQIEEHYRAGGDFNNVLTVLLQAQAAGVELTFEEVAALELADDDGESLAALMSRIGDKRA
ncbi:MAG: hypothetical protein Rubg2KO_00380 [Rubricoccaceae bacterium]